MRSHRTLAHWCRQLLPLASTCARAAGRELVLALCLDFTTNLAQLARQTDRAGTTKSQRQRLTRWLDSPTWDAPMLYSRLNRLTRRVLRRGAQVLLLLDTTHLQDRWVVLQVSVPWQGRALPLYRVVYPYAGSERDQPAAVRETLCWLRRHLPGPRERYILVADRGFPSTAWIAQLQAQRWRFVLRVKGNWRMESPGYTGLMREAPLLAGGVPYYPEAVLGWRDARKKGPDPRGRAAVVHYWDPTQQAPWYLVTSESQAGLAIAWYRQRMQIEQEFRDLKGRWGLDALGNWGDVQRVARFLAWVAVYEWRLVYFWLFQSLLAWEKELRVYGKLSWLRTTREWLARQVRSSGRTALDCL